MIKLIPALVALSFAAVPTQDAPRSLLTLDVELIDGVYRVTHVAGGAPFTSLHADSVRLPFLWPLHGASGHEMTRGFPMEAREDEATDHPHHQSMWLAHGDVNGLDFWHDPACRIDTAGAPRIKRTVGLFEVEIVLPLLWKGPDGAEILREERTYRFASRRSMRLIEVTAVLTPTNGDVVFGDTKEGTFALRLRPELRLKGKVARASILNSEGQKDGACWGQSARWVAYEATLDPIEPGSPAIRVGISAFDHAKNLRHPTRWHARDYGLLAANPFGAHDFTGKPKGTGDHLLSEGKSLEMRWLVALYEEEDGRAVDGEELDALWRWWVAQD